MMKVVRIIRPLEGDPTHQKQVATRGAPQLALLHLLIRSLSQYLVRFDADPFRVAKLLLVDFQNVSCEEQ
jgi:hypothetical protein